MSTTLENSQMVQAASVAEKHVYFDDLLFLRNILEKHQIPYFLAGGTMLGAVRDGAMIAHDLDFDLDVLVEDEARIFALADELEAGGLLLQKKIVPLTQVVPSNDTGIDEADFTANVYACCIKVEKDGESIGDLYVFTTFSDGIARRYDFATRTLYNPKMSIPAWYYEGGGSTVYIYGEPFTTVRSPEQVCRKVYGHDWHIPLKRGEFEKGRNASSGSDQDASLTMLIRHALDNGWDNEYHSCPEWPQSVAWVNTKTGRSWMRNHEPFLHTDVQSLLNAEILDTLRNETSLFRVEQYIRYVAGVALHARREEMNSYYLRIKNLEKVKSPTRDIQRKYEQKRILLNQQITLLTEKNQTLSEKNQVISKKNKTLLKQNKLLDQEKQALLERLTRIEQASLQYRIKSWVQGVRQKLEGKRS